MAKLDPLPRSLAHALASIPDPGNRNVWIFTIATRARLHASPDKVRSFLHRIVAQWTDRDFAPEVDRAVTRAFTTPDQPLPFSQPPSSPKAPHPRWPTFNPDAWHRRRDSPILFGSTPLPIPPERILDQLYPPTPTTNPAEGPLLCLALDTASAHTQPREKWRGLEPGLQFIVANPMTAPTGLNQDGRVSPRCLDNATRRRRFQVVEFDRGTLQEQAAILSSLHSPPVPLVMVVWSAGKSLHGWFDVSPLSAYWKLRFFRHAVYLGADASLWDPSKLVRLPGGRRSNGKTQAILHFNLNQSSHL